MALRKAMVIAKRNWRNASGLFFDIAFKCFIILWLLSCQQTEEIRQRRIEWAWEKGLPLFNTLLALIAAIAGIISILLQLNLI